MVNDSLNWASIVGIVLAVGGALLYFMRSFKPALARDYDVFFAAIGLLCGGILFFQGWRLDPILQFGQFLLAGTTVFFAYESVRLRGVATEQARRSAYFDDEPCPRARAWDAVSGAPMSVSTIPSPSAAASAPAPMALTMAMSAVIRRISIARAVLSAVRSLSGLRAALMRPMTTPAVAAAAAAERSRYGASREPRPEFGARRRERDASSTRRSGSRPSGAADDMPRSSRRPSNRPVAAAGADRSSSSMPEGAPISDADFSPISSRPAPSQPGNRDNSSRFDD